MKTHIRLIISGSFFILAITGCLIDKEKDQGRVFISFRAPQVAWDSVNQMDSTFLVADILDSKWGLNQVTWSLGRLDSIVATNSMSGDTLIDSLRFGWARQGPYMVYVRTRNAAGSFRTDSLRVNGNSAPGISGTPPLRLYNGQEFLFTPGAVDPDFDTLRFSVTNLPAWISFNSANGLMRGTPTVAQIGAYNGIVLRVSDGRRVATLPFDLAVTANPWRLKQGINTTAVIYGGAELGGNIYFSIRKLSSLSEDSLYAYNPTTDSWTGGVAIPGSPVGLIALNGELLAFMDDSVKAFDTTGNTWGARNSVPPDFGYFVKWGGKAYQINANTVTEYDPILNVWNVKRVPPFLARGTYPTSVAVAGNIIHVIEARISDGMGTGTVQNYDPVQDIWVDGPQIPIPAKLQSLCAGGGRIFLVGGATPYGGSFLRSNRVDRLNQTTGVWESRTPALLSGNFGPCAEVGGKIYVFGVASSPSMPGTLSGDMQEYNPAVDI